VCFNPSNVETAFKIVKNNIMSKVILSLLVLFLYQNLLGQDTTHQVPLMENYLKKSKVQKIAGWILLAGGVGMLAGSVATYQAEPYIDFFPEQPLTTESRDNTLSTFLAVGAAGAMIGGVLYLASAGANKKRAASLSMSNQPLFLPWHKPWQTRTHTTMSLRIALR
jgi:hypothetical protein